MATPTGMRQCGRRKKGGVYLTVAESPDGQPLESFLMCPPIPVDLAALGISPRGAFVKEMRGGHHVLDVIGEQSYPNVWDFVVEGHCGISRLVNLPDYSLLNADSRLITIHKRAIIANWDSLRNEMNLAERDSFLCPREYDFHRFDSLKEMCLGVCPHTIEGMDEEASDGERRIRGIRNLACGSSYRGWRGETFTPQFAYGIFGSFPLGPIQIIEDPADRTHLSAIEKVKSSGLSFEVVSE